MQMFREPNGIYWFSSLHYDKRLNSLRPLCGAPTRNLAFWSFSAILCATLGLRTQTVGPISLYCTGKCQLNLLPCLLSVLESVCFIKEAGTFTIQFIVLTFHVSWDTCYHRCGMEGQCFAVPSLGHRGAELLSKGHANCVNLTGKSGTTCCLLLKGFMFFSKAHCSPHLPTSCRFNMRDKL